ncbi:transcription initiation factor TFIID subunit 4-like isoform X1 [Cervus elaphus]|uniref:transcription initiation factor TFIID subunit 4-like isoform X1 n=1 Tax=Cervus elaphus TaxID=9860 RepID=UPI001CC3030D|nr:transcription initiation factor TFIID subunit 4-like isoform X1 [Cervus elaphus]
MQMRPRSQLAAARRGGAVACGTRARGRHRLTSRAPRFSSPGCGPAGRELLRPRWPPGPGRRQQTLAASARRLFAGAPGSPLYSVCAAARAPPPPPGAPPGAGGRGQGSGRRLCLSGPLGSRASCAPARRAGRSAGRLPPLVLGVSPHAGPARAQVVSPSPDLLSGLVSALRAPPAAGPAQRLAAGAERSAHAGVAGLRQDQLSEPSLFPAGVLPRASNCVSFTKQQLWAPGKAQENHNRRRKRTGWNRLLRDSATAFATPSQPDS